MQHPFPPRALNVSTRRMVNPNNPGPLLIMVGPMAAGKTTLGREIAKWLGVDFIDTDQFIEHLHQQKVSEIFVQKGESEFRQIEANAIEHLLQYFPGVIALGGGAVTTEKTRELLKTHRVMWLQVELENIADRITRNRRRPLLNVPNPGEKWQEIADARVPFFEEVSSHAIKPAKQPPRQVAQAIVDQMKLLELMQLRKKIAATPPAYAAAANGAMASPATDAPKLKLSSLPAADVSGNTVIAVGDTENSYEVVVGRNLIEEITNFLPAKSAKVLIVHQAVVTDRAEVLRSRIQASGREVFLAEIPDGEAAKTAQVLAFLWQVLGQTDFTRSDLIIGMGGGAATDLAGFTAASWLRGIDLIQVPTTVAAMVDAAVGGKTGINTAEGKNLVGAFYPPKAVFADLTALASLPKFDVAAGLAEVVKAGFIADETILQIIEANPELALDVASPEFTEIMIRAIWVKAQVVSNDLTEQGVREILNYGHTFGHAIERCERYQWRHGAAVAVGMVFAAELARLSGKIDEELVQRHRNILSQLGLPITYRAGMWEQLLEAIRRDKKSRGALLRFVVLKNVEETVMLEGPDPALLVAAYAAVSEHSL